MPSRRPRPTQLSKQRELLSAPWCRFVLKHHVNIGLSIDGPAWIHDRHRKTRRGEGTHAKAMAGLHLLQEHGIPFHVICVLTRDSLGHADEIFDFFVDFGVRQLCFNMEEIEGMHDKSSLAVEGVETEFHAFFERILGRLRQHPGVMRIREVEDVLHALRHPDFGKLTSNSQNEPFEIVSIAYDGRFSTFSPELLGIRDTTYGSFAFGNVHQDEIIGIENTESFRRVARDIAEGVHACQASCKYFCFCRGGAPGNKLAETGTFASTETLFCRLTQKTIVECVLNAVESDLQMA